MPKPRTKQCQADIHKLLESRREVAIIWSIADVNRVRRDLRADQCSEVPQECVAVHDCGWGFTWDLIQAVADDLFPVPKKAKASHCAALR